MTLKYIFDLSKVCFNDVSHPSQVFEQGGYFLLKCGAKDICELGLHLSDDAFDFFLVGSILGEKGALKFHNSFHDERELVHFLFFFVR